MAKEEKGKRLLQADDLVDTDEKPKKKKKRKIIENVPLTKHYHISWMHAAPVTAVVASHKHGYVISASADGMVKFWKRVPVQLPKDVNKNRKKEEDQVHPCLEFAKSFHAHSGAVQALVIDDAGDQVASVGADGLIKYYDVSTFDVTSFLDTNKTLGTCACWCGGFLAVSSGSDVLIIASNEVTKTISLHGDDITGLLYHDEHQVVMSTDKKGSIQFWDASNEESAGETTSRGMVYESKTETDLYALLKKKTHAIAVCRCKNTFAFYGADHKIRIFYYSSGKCVVTLDERLSIYKDQDSIEWGRKMAIEKEIESESTVFAAGLGGKDPQRLSIQFDKSGDFIVIPSVVGIKVIDWKRRKMAGIVGKEDAKQLRFVGCCFGEPEAVINKQLQLARGVAVTSRSEMESEQAVINDAIVIALAYDQRRLYVFSHLDPTQDKDAFESRDVWNEAPTSKDIHAHAQTRGNEQKTATGAILRTTVGDIHIQLYAAKVPKTVENFVGHSRSGYYDNVIFHRVIKGFMLQTGDPNGDGTGGESIWGGEFEDEIVPSLRHDRPFVVSMANAGANTNGSQFFITTVPTPWLDNKHTVFGRVTRGMDICSKIENVATDDLDKPKQTISICNVDVVNS